MQIKKRLAVTASLLAMGLSAHAAQERYIVTFADGKGPSVKSVAAKAPCSAEAWSPARVWPTKSKQAKPYPTGQHGSITF